MLDFLKSLGKSPDEPKEDTLDELLEPDINGVDGTVSEIKLSVKEKSKHINRTMTAKEYLEYSNQTQRN